MGFRDSILNLAPPWLLERVGGGILYVAGLVQDVVSDAWLKEGIKARFPDTAPPDALGFIGNDRDLERGPSESDASYVIRLRQAIDTWRNAGGGRTILSELAAYFTDIATPPMRLVSDSAIWHVYDWATGITTRTAALGNWTWDADTGTSWWRGWAIVDSTSGPWSGDTWDDTDDSLWGDGGVWGSNMTVDEVASLRRIVGKWKPAHIACVNVIVTFAAIFRDTDTAPPNPNGNGDDSVWRAGLDAAFLEGVI